MNRGASCVCNRLGNRAFVTLFESLHFGKDGREGVGVLRWVANTGGYAVEKATRLSQKPAS